MNIARNLAQAAFYFPDHTAVIEGDIAYTYRRFYGDVERVASGLTAIGVQPGEHMAFCAPNSYQWLVFYFAALATGAVAVTFSHLLAPHEISRILSDCRPRFFITSEERLELLAGRREWGYPEYVVCQGGDFSFADIYDRGTPGFDTVSRSRDDVAAILYTGGTTGTPKGAMLTHQNLLTSAYNVARHERSTEKDRALLFLPLNHVFGQVHIMHSLIFVGGGLIVQNGFDMEKALDAIARHRITNFYAVPTLYIRLLTLPDLKQRFNSIRYCFSAASSMATEVVRAWKEQTGLDIHESYGMTESAAMVTYNHYYRHVVGSIGTPVNLMEVAIRDASGKTVATGEHGEICIRGHNIFKGYLNNPEETRAAFWADGFFRSGDVGISDSDGYLYIIDRLKDLIITGGENVYPREVEEILYAWHQISECAVVGLPDKEYGERVVAFVVAKPGQDIDKDALKRFLKEKLAGYKVPKEFIVREALPKSNAGKLLKRELRKQYSA